MALWKSCQVHTKKSYMACGMMVFLRGAVTDEVAEASLPKAKRCVGQAGSVCLMHTRLLHGSTANMSENPRTLFICVYTAEDAVPVSSSAMPTKYEGMVVRGEKTNRVRSVPVST